MFRPKPFTIPLVSSFGPGTQDDQDLLDFMPMPAEMAAAPTLPEPALLAQRDGALAALRGVMVSLRGHLDGTHVAPVELAGLDDMDLALLNMVLGEGEVTAQVTGDDGVQAQESMFAGVWRVLHRKGDAVARDTIEVGAFPRAITDMARGEGQPMAPLPGLLPADTMNAPAVLEELRDRSRAWLKGRPRGDDAHVVNLSLLPLTSGDVLLFEQQLGRGRVLILSRGHGNCRVVNTRAAGVWRVTYYNPQDVVILDTLEVGDVPEVACAARRDLEDSATRLAEMLQWVESS